ncbi:MAG: YggT family protein [Cellulomonadaceae bacterium]|nr:YggT family protein [Cellulomonadaceae bacterium]
MRTLLHIAGFILWLYLLCFVVRMVLDWVRFFARGNFRPRGAALVLAEGVYTVTDPPLKLARRFIPPLRIGNVGLDVGFMLVFFLVLIISQVLSSV